MNDPKTKSIIGWCLSLSIYLSIYLRFFSAHSLHSLTHSLCIYGYGYGYGWMPARSSFFSHWFLYIYIYILFQSWVESSTTLSSPIAIARRPFQSRTQWRRTDPHSTLYADIYIYIYLRLLGLNLYSCGKQYSIYNEHITRYLKEKFSIYGYLYLLWVKRAIY